MQVCILDVRNENAFTLHECGSNDECPLDPDIEKSAGSAGYKLEWTIQIQPYYYYSTRQAAGLIYQRKRNTMYIVTLFAIKSIHQCRLFLRRKFLF